jgi:hypothetical protein
MSFRKSLVVTQYFVVNLQETASERRCGRRIHRDPAKIAQPRSFRNQSLKHDLRNLL